MLPCSINTDSGIEVKLTVHALLADKLKFGFKDGLAISDHEGKMFRMQDLDEMLYEVLVDVFEDHRPLFPDDITSLEKVKKHYQCFRSFRRASNTRALEQKVATSDIDIVNRWKKVEAGGGRRPGFSMQQHYAQFDLLLKPFLRYTKAM